MAEETELSLRNEVIYQIFTRNYKGGKLKSVEADLERIRALGVDIIYLLPVQPSGVLHRKGTMGSPYAISDYRAIDPVIGTMEDFSDLSKAVHDHGMKLVIDVVYNHTSPDSVLAKSHPEWFFHKADGSLGNRIGDWWDVVDLDYSSSADLWDYQIDTLKMWAKYVDGFRCDVAPMVPLAFWKKARLEVEKVRPGCIWIAESIEPEMIMGNRKMGFPTSTDSELYQAFDVCYDYDVYYAQKAAITDSAYDTVSAAQVGTDPGALLQEYLRRVNMQEGTYPENYVKLRCLENHDRPRAAAMVPDEMSLRNWTAWQYFQKGVVMLYAGQEAEVTRHPTLFDPDPVNFETGKDISPLLAKLAAIRKDSLTADLFRDSDFEAKVISGDVILAQRARRGMDSPVQTSAEHTPRKSASRMIGIFSTHAAAKSVEVDLPDGTYSNLIDGKQYDVFEKVLTLDGDPVIFAM